MMEILPPRLSLSGQEKTGEGLGPARFLWTLQDRGHGLRVRGQDWFQASLTWDKTCSTSLYNLGSIPRPGLASVSPPSHGMAIPAASVKDGHAGFLPG